MYQSTDYTDHWLYTTAYNLQHALYITVESRELFVPGSALPWHKAPSLCLHPVARAALVVTAASALLNASGLPAIDCFDRK